jgi:hypothetical protein
VDGLLDRSVHGHGEVPTQSGQGFGKVVPYEVFHAGDDDPFYIAVI